MTVTSAVLGVSYLTHVPQARTEDGTTTEDSHVDFLNLIVDINIAPVCTESSSLLAFHQTHLRQLVPPMTGSVAAKPLAVVRSRVEKALFIMGQTSACCMVCLVPQSQVSGSFENPHFNMFTLQLDRPTCVRNRLSAFQVSQGVLCASWEVFVSTDVKVYTAVQGHELFSTQLHASSFRRRVDVLSAFDKALPRFQAWHHSEVSIEWVPLVRSLLCPLRTTFHRSHYVWWRDSDEYG